MLVAKLLDATASVMSSWWRRILCLIVLVATSVRIGWGLALDGSVPSFVWALWGMYLVIVVLDAIARR